MKNSKIRKHFKKIKEKVILNRGLKFVQIKLLYMMILKFYENVVSSFREIVVKGNDQNNRPD